MIRRTHAALAAVSLLGLAACGDTEETTIVEDEPAATETVDVELPDNDPPMDGTATGDTETGDSVEFSEDGVDATVNDGNTSVEADIDEDPSMRVETD